MAELQHDVRPTGAAPQYHHPLPPEVLRLPVVVAVEDLTSKMFSAGNVGDDGLGVLKTK